MPYYDMYVRCGPPGSVLSAAGQEARPSICHVLIVSGITETYVCGGIQKVLPLTFAKVYTHVLVRWSMMPAGGGKPWWCLQYDCHALVSPCNTHMIHLQQAEGLLKQRV